MQDSLLPHWNAWLERRDRVITIANSITEDALLFQPGEDEWTIKDVIQHLQMTDYRFGNSAQKRLATMLEKDPVGPQSEKNLQLLNERLRTFGKLSAPELINPILIDETISWHELQQRWARVGVLWVQTLSAIPEAALDRPLTRHPRIGVITASQFLRWNCAHYDNHIAQIKSNQRSFAERNIV